MATPLAASINKIVFGRC